HYPGWDRFENAFLNDPVCCPSRASILTGLYAHHTGIENNADRSNFDDSSTIATWLHGAGYRTALFGKYHLLHNGAGPTYIPPGWIPAPRHEGRFATEPIPHAPSFNEPDMSDKPSWWQARTPVKVPDIDNGRRKAYASLLGVDDLVKSVFDTLTKKGLVDNTVV